MERAYQGNLDANWSIKCSTEATKENLITKILVYCLNKNKQTVLLGNAPFNIVDIFIEIGTTKRDSIEASKITMPSDNQNQSSNFLGLSIKNSLAEAFVKAELPFSVKFDTIYDEKAPIKLQLNIFKGDYNENLLIKTALVIWRGIVSDFRFNKYITPTDEEVRDMLLRDNEKKEEAKVNAAQDIFQSFFSEPEPEEEEIPTLPPIVEEEPEVVEDEEVIVEPEIKIIGGLINAIHNGKDYTDEVFLVTAGGSAVGGPIKGLTRIAGMLSNGYRKKDIVVKCLNDEQIVFERKAKTN